MYKLPAVTKENETLKQQQEVWNSCAAVTVKYTFGEQTEILDGMTVKEWMTYDETAIMWKIQLCCRNISGSM